MYQVEFEYILWLFWGMSLDFCWNKSVDNPCNLLLRLHLRAELRVFLQSMERSHGISTAVDASVPQLVVLGVESSSPGFRP